MRHLALALAVVVSSLEAQVVTLQSVVVNGGQATVTYSKDFATCAHLKLLNGTLVHSQNVFCTQGTNVVVNVPLSGFNSFFALGIQVMLCHGNNGSICSSPVTVTVDPAFVASPPTISLAAGGTQTLSIAGSPLAAGFTYLIAGSLSGTSPGVSVFQFFVPLNPDDWFAFTVANPNTPPLSGFQGLLDAAGTGAATLTLPPGLPPALAGITVNHAVGLVSPAGVIVGVSAAVSLTAVP